MNTLSVISIVMHFFSMHATTHSYCVRNAGGIGHCGFVLYWFKEVIWPEPLSLCIRLALCSLQGATVPHIMKVCHLVCHKAQFWPFFGLPAFR